MNNKKYRVQTDILQKKLKEQKLYDENTHFLICPSCYNYSVRYIHKSKKWFCNTCESIGNIYYDHDLNLTDSDKYQIYKFWGIDALSQLTYETLDEIKKFIASYFKKGCSSLKNKCMYYNYFKEQEISEHISSIDRLFDKAKRNYSLLKKDIDDYLKLIENQNYFSDEEMQKELKDKYISFRQTVEQIVEHFEDYFITVAETDLKEGQKVYVKEHDNDLIVDLNSIGGIEYFAWNDAKKGDMVGVATLHPDSLKYLRQMFKELTEKYRLESLKNLSSLEKKVLFLIRSRKNGILQNQLWRTLRIDSSKCSRVVMSLSRKDLITRTRESLGGVRTYRLKIEK